MSLKLVKYFYTLRYLKIQQILWRVWFILIKPSPNVLPMPELQEISGIFSQPARRRISLIDSNTFFFLGQKENLKNIGWDNPQITKLWRYNQHYFDDLNAKNTQERVIWHTNLLKRWVDENTPGIGSGWEVACSRTYPAAPHARLPACPLAYLLVRPPRPPPVTILTHLLGRSRR